ncbi:hypothetical protein DIPPA_05785 [Diplonema papillatum]|nr:hypothetical protein DIPPA_05785 [Diplonema papillatum]
MFYLDGVLDSTHRLGTQLPFGPTSSVFLGEVKDGRVFGKTWEGAMAEFKMWNRALSASEVADDSTMCQSLVGWWRMEGDMNDSSRAQQTGSVAGSVEPGTDSCGRAGRSLHFGGTGSDYATLPTPEYYTGLQDFTVSTWVYCQSLVNDPGLFSMHSLGETNELMLQPQENGTIALVLRGTSYISDEAAITELDKWYHIAAVRLWDTLTLYVDGSVFHTTSCVVDPLLPMVGIVFGQDHENLQSFEGNLRDFRIYNYALTDVRGLQGLPSPPACPTFNNQPVFRYKMDSLEMKDSSGNGVLSGMLDTVTAGEPLIRCLSVPCTGESLNFPGNSASTGFGAIPAGPLLSGINDFTVSFWVKDLDPSAGGVAVNLFAQYSDATSCDDEIVFRRDTGDVLSVHINCEEFRSAESMFPSDRSIMWTVTRRGREVAVYRNGLLLTSFDHPRQVPIGWIPPNGTYVGHAVVGTPDAGKAWEGVVADFQFWEGAMAAAEVAKAYETAFCDCPAAHSETVSRFALNGNFNETGAADQGSDGGSFSISRDSVCGGSLAVGEGIQHTLRTTARPSKAFTMALYAKPVLPFSSGVRVLLHVGGPDARSGFGFGVDANHRLVIRDSPDAGGLRSLDVEVEPGWRHYVVVYNGEAMVIYVDELVVYEEVVYLTLPTADSWGQLSVGGVDGDTEGGTDGEWLVDEIVLFEGAAAVADARSLCDLRAVFSRYTADAESNLLLDYGPAHNEGHGVTSYGSSFVCGRAVVLYENEEHCIHPAREVPLYAEPWTVSAYAFAPVPGDRAFVHLGDDESEGRGFGLGFMQGSLVWSTKSGEWKVVHPARTIIASHHYAATYDSNVIRFYIDEEEVGAVNYTFDLRKGSEQSSMCVGCTRCGDAPEMKHGTWRIDEAVFARGVIPMAEMRARCAIPARGPFARYPLDEDLVDISPAGNVLPGVFNPSSESICGGGSLQLDKEFLHTSVAAMDAPHLGPWTISLYAKRVEKGLQTSRRVLLRFRSGVTQVGFGVDDDDKLIVFLARTETLQPSVPIPVDDDWHHYTLTFNGSMLQLYMDEVMEADWAFEYNLAGLTTVPTISIGDTGSSFNDGVWLVDEVVFGRGVLPHAALRCPAVVSHLPLNGGWNDLGPANNEFPGEYEGDDDTVCGGSLRVPPGKLHVSENWKQLARGAEAWAVMLYAKCIVPGKRLFFAVGNLASLHAGIGLGVSGNGGLVLQVSSGRHIPVNATKVDRFWHRYAVAYNGSRVEVFVDDALVFGVDWPLDLQSDRFAIAAGAAEGEWLFDELVVGHGPVHLHFRSTCGTREVFTKYSFDGNFADTAVAENNNPTANLQFVDDSMCGKSLLLDDNVFYALDNTNTEPGSVHWSMANYAACIKGEASSSTCDGKPLRDVLQEVTFCDCSEGCTVFPKGLPQKSEPWTVSLYVKGKVGGNRAFIQLGQAGRELGHFSFGVGAGMQLWISLGGPPRDIAGLSAELGSWNHYVAAYDSNLLTVFVDGVAVHEEYVVLNLPRCSEMGNLVIGSQLGPLQRDTRRGEWLFDDIRLGLGVVPFDKLQQLCDTGAPLSPPVVPP